MNVGYSNNKSVIDLNRWIININPRPNAVKRLFCFPYAGSSSAVVFRKWAFDLPDSVEVIPVELPGRGARLNEPLETRVEPLAKRIAKVLSNFSDKPFEIFGHSMGSLIGYEVSKILTGHYRLVPQRLYVSAHQAPYLERNSVVMHKLSETEFRNELRNLNGMEDDILNNPELMEIFSPIIRADYEICETYKFNAGKLDIPVIAFGGMKDKTVKYEHLLGWENITSNKFDIYMLDGDHFFIVKNQKEFLTLFKKILLNNIN